MNYRHIYHAGNFADIFKHLILTMVLSHLRKKEKGYFVLDAFAGCGLYDLKSIEAEKTQEYRSGIEAFMDMKLGNADLQEFQSILRPYWASGLYPGSPVLAAESLREQDRLLANELQPEDFRTLRKTLRSFPKAKPLHLDAYESIRGSLPPAERRGLVLIDPPFERRDEFEILARQMEEWIRRWADGCYMIWYPIKANSNETLLFDAAQDLPVNRSWSGEFMMKPRRTAESFNGCGVLILNPPFQIPERIEGLASELCAALGGMEISSHWLRQD